MKLRKSPANVFSLLFLGSGLGITWEDLGLSQWSMKSVVAQFLDLNNDGSPEWIVREDIWTEIGPGFAESLYWIDTETDITSLSRREIWKAIRGEAVELDGANYYSNLIFPFDVSHLRYKGRPFDVFLFDVIKYGAKNYLLASIVKDDARPQLINIIVFSVRQKLKADPICKIQSRSKVTGLLF